MRRLLAFLLGSLPAIAGAMQGPWNCQYGAPCTLPLDLYETDGILPYGGDPPNPTTDFFVSCAQDNSESLSGVSSSGRTGTYSFRFVLDDTDCPRIRVIVRDADGPGNDYLSTSVAVQTCGDPSAAFETCQGDIARWAGAAVVTPRTAGLPEMRLAENVEHGGGTSTRVVINNSGGSGDAWEVVSNSLSDAASFTVGSGGGVAFRIDNNGTGVALDVEAAAGTAVDIDGANSGVLITGQGNYGIFTQGQTAGLWVNAEVASNGDAVVLNADGTGSPVNYNGTEMMAAIGDQIWSTETTRTVSAATNITDDGTPINVTGGAIDTVIANTDMRGTDNAAPAATALSTAQWTNARAANLDNLAGHTAQTGDSFAILSQLTEDVAGLRYTAKALEEAPGGGAGSDVNVVSWNGTLLATTNPLPNAVPGGDGGLATVSGGLLTQPVQVNTYEPTLDFTANQKSSINVEVIQVTQSQRLHELMVSPLVGQPTANSMFGDLTQSDGSQQQFTANALALGPTAALTELELARALGGFVADISSVTNDTTFELSLGPTAADSINDEYTVSVRDASNADIPTCHRQVLDYVPPGTLVMNEACPAGFVVSAGDSVVVLPNGAGDKIAAVNATNGAVDVNFAQPLDGLSHGCMLAAVNAVQTGAQTVVNGTDYTYRNPGDTEDRVVATRTASGRTQATITCPAGL